MSWWKFFGFQETHYPEIQHPDGGVLRAQPGDVLPFNPGDGQWHEVDENGERVEAAPEAPPAEAAPEVTPEAEAAPDAGDAAETPAAP